MKDVTIIIPAYNVEKYIGKCIDSLILQANDILEMIIINDGSKDRTQEIIDLYCSRYDWIYSIQQDNSGQSIARNKGLECAKGKYIVFIDSDDYVADDYVAKLKNEMENLDMVCCGAYQVSETELDILNKEIPLQLKLNGKNVIMPGAVWGKIYRKDIIQQYGLRFKPGVFFEDALFNLEYFAVTETMKKIDYYGYYQRINADSSFGKMNTLGISDNKIPYEGLKEVLNFCMSYPEKKEEIEFLVIRFFTVFIFDFARGASIQTVKNINQWIEETLNTFYPQYYQNEYVRLFSQKDIPFIQRIGVTIFIYLERFHLLKISSLFFTRPFLKNIFRTRYEN